MATTQRIFVTGVSGYIGGHTVTRLLEKHPNWNVAVLVRNEKQKATVLATWPTIEVVIGSLDNTQQMIDEGAKSDVVLQTASADHILGIPALIEGLSKKSPKPGYFIHVGGTGILHEVSNGFGNSSDKIYSDIADLKEITSFPVENHVHRDVDAAVLAANLSMGVPTAILCPPTVHGKGIGPMKTRSLQIPLMIEATLKSGKGFQVLEGKNYWDEVHIDDLADGFVLLVEEALKPNGGKAQWGQSGYYFCGSGEFQWGDAAAAVTKELYKQGAIKSDSVEKLTLEEAQLKHPWAPVIWGGNCRSRADRLKALGWVAKKQGLQMSLPEMVAEEIKTQGTMAGTALDNIA